MFYILLSVLQSLVLQIKPTGIMVKIVRLIGDVMDKTLIER